MVLGESRMRLSNHAEPLSLDLFRNYINTYQNHGAQARYNGKSIVSTFSGSDCTFGQGSTNNGWSAVFGAHKSNVRTMCVNALTVDLLHAGLHQRAELVQRFQKWRLTM